MGRFELCLSSLSLLVVVSLVFLAASSAVLAEDDPLIIASPASGVAPLLVSFSTNIPEAVAYAWDFDGDGKTDSEISMPTFTYAKEGTYSVTVSITKTDGTSQELNKVLSVLAPLSVSLTANPASGTAPLTVQFIAASTGKAPLLYTWDFNGDGTAESTLQNPSYIFENPGNYSVGVSVTDAQGSQGSQVQAVSVASYDSGLNLSSAFPTALQKGENQVTFLLVNNGNGPLRDVSARLVGKGIQHFSSSSLVLLKPGEQDSIAIKASFLEAGEINAFLKTMDKSFPVVFKVAEQVSYNKEELQSQYQKIKEQVQQQESIYQEKKLDGYLVNEVYDNLKLTQKQLQDAQQQLLTNKLADAKINLDLASSTIADVAYDLENVKKQKVSVLMWLKENAVAITAIVAASGTISGILIKVKNKASKLGENVKLKISPVGRRKDEDVPSVQQEAVSSREEVLSAGKVEKK